MKQNTDEPLQYIIRFSERARRDIEAAYVWIAETATPDLADAWLAELDTEIAGLTQFPRRCPAVQENFHQEVRQLLHRRQGSQMSHRIFFVILHEEADTEDPPTIKIIHVRHSSRRPLTRREIREIQAND